MGRWLLPLAARSPLSPNTISVIAVLINCFAAWLLSQGGRSHRLFLLAILFIAAGGLADALDGAVARAQQKESRMGDFIDHLCDRISDFALLAGWLLGNSVAPFIALLAIGATMLNGYAGTQIEATYGIRNYDSIGRGEFVLALIVYPVASFLIYSMGYNERLAGPLRLADWLAIVMIVMAWLATAQRVLSVRALERP